MKKIILIFTLLTPFFINAQEEQAIKVNRENNEIHVVNDNNENHENHKTFKRHRISLAISQSYIPSIHLHEGDASAQIIPTNGIEYQFFFTHKFSAKWINEVEFLTYTVKGEDGEHRVRDNAFLSAIVLGYEVYDHLGIFAGVGYEFEDSEDLWVTRIGAEYSFELPRYWDITPAAIFDYKKDSHTAYTFSLTIGRRF